MNEHSNEPEVLRILTQAMQSLRARNYQAARNGLLETALLLCRSSFGQPLIRKTARFELAYRLVAIARGLSPAALPAAERSAETADGGSPWLVHEKPAVRFSDIAGLDDVKEAIRTRLIYPFVYPEKAAFYGVKKGGGLLLYGPPGTGKTMIARAVAAEIEAPFFNVLPSEIMSKWVGEAEQNIRKLFQAAQQYPRAVIFIDEVESLIPKRRTSGSTVMQRVVPQILAELEGFEGRTNALLFIGATNEPWSLDAAVLRPGRFDKKVYVGLPDYTARLWLLQRLLASKPLAGDLDLAAVAQTLDGYSGADLKNIADVMSETGLQQSIASGANLPLTAAHLTLALARIKPSVTDEECKKYTDFAAQN